MGSVTQQRYVLDTNILIALTKGNAKLGKHMARHDRSAFAVPSVVLQELYYGAWRSDAHRQQSNLANVRHIPFATLNFNAQDAEMAGRIRATLARAGNPIGPYDLLIAAQALTRNLTVITHNTREFARVEGLRVEDWLD